MVERILNPEKLNIVVAPLSSKSNYITNIQPAIFEIALHYSETKSTVSGLHLPIVYNEHNGHKLKFETVTILIGCML
jgi:hypothetical protein